MAKAFRVFSVCGIQAQQPSCEQSIHAHQLHLHKCCCAILKAWPSILPGTFPCLCLCQQAWGCCRRQWPGEPPSPRVLSQLLRRWEQRKYSKRGLGDQPVWNGTWKPPAEAVLWAGSFLPGTSTGSGCSSSFDRPLEVRSGPPLYTALSLPLKFSLSHGN